VFRCSRRLEPGGCGAGARRRTIARPHCVAPGIGSC
jgi:hypothetical protein